MSSDDKALSEVTTQKSLNDFRFLVAEVVVSFRFGGGGCPLSVAASLLWLLVLLFEAL